MSRFIHVLFRAPIQAILVASVGLLINPLQARAQLNCPAAFDEQPPTEVGRILRGTEPEDFIRLTNDTSRKIIFVTNQAGLAELAPKDLYGKLETVGYDPQEDIAPLLAKGTRFKLVKFRPSRPFYKADWDHLALLAKQAYRGRVLKALLDRYLPQLKKLTFEEIEAQAPDTFAQLKLRSKTDPFRITYRKLTVNSKLWELRAFLYNEVYVTKLYHGDGYTYDKNGKRGLPEYIGNVGWLKLDAIGDYTIEDIN